MRILHVNKFLYRRGGAEAYMLDVAELQRAAGHDVEFFAMEHPDNVPSAYDSAFPPYMELDPPPERLGTRLRTAANVFWSPRARRSMDDVLARFRPDAVHLHNVYHQLSPSILRPVKARRIPAVMTLHDYKLACPTYQFLDHGAICEACVPRHFHHAALRRCNHGSLAASALLGAELTVHTLTRAYSPVDVFVCPSRFLLGKMVEGKVFPDRLRHLPHFAQLDRIGPADTPGRDVVVAGRLASEKGIDVAIDAIALLPDVRLTIAGDGPARAELEARATAVAPDRIEFTGRLDASTLHATIRRAAAVLVPSRWHENQPMIVLEAFACGRPVIASDLGGLPELVRDGIDGALVPHDDPAALASAIAAAIGDRVRAHEMGAVGRARVLTEFSIDAHLAGLDEMYALATAHRAGQR